MENIRKQRLYDAAKIGVTCVFTYFVSYCLRNVLSVSSVDILGEGRLTKEAIGFFSSVYLIVYAAGQLLNGLIGDIVKPKYMAACGLLLSGAASIVFPFLSSYAGGIAVFAVMGFGLSMLRGPFVKTISENMEARYARVCCVCLSSTSFCGPLVVGLAAMFCRWRALFVIFGAFTVGMAAVSFCLLTLLERWGKIRALPGGGSVRTGFAAIFRLDHFPVYMLIAMIAEISASSITFWIPAYTAERLGLSEIAASSVLSAVSLAAAAAPFVCLAMLKLFRENRVRMMRTMFVSAAVLYVVMFLCGGSRVNILLLMLARFLIGCASSLIWSVYVPGLAKSGKVSGAGGVLDFSGYLGASAANALFSAVMPMTGWNGIVLMWCGCMLLGLGATFFLRGNGMPTSGVDAAQQPAPRG